MVPFLRQVHGFAADPHRKGASLGGWRAAELQGLGRGGFSGASQAAQDQERRHARSPAMAAARSSAWNTPEPLTKA